MKAGIFFGDIGQHVGRHGHHAKADGLDFVDAAFGEAFDVLVRAIFQERNLSVSAEFLS